MKVLQVIDTAGPGGAETVFLLLAQGLTARRIGVSALLPYEASLTHRLRDSGIMPHVIESRGSFKVGYVLQLARLARRERVDVIHAHLIGSATYSAMAGRLVGIPVVATFHGPTDVAGASSFRSIRAWMLRNLASSVTAVSRSTLSALGEFGVAASRVQFIANGIDTDRFTLNAPATLRKELGLADGSPVFGAVGNVRPAKAYDVLVRAAAIVLKKLPDAQFLVAGQGDDSQMAPLLALRRDLGIEARFRFLGHRHCDASLYRSFDVFVSSSHSEGLPLSFLEAMACGCRVVATASGGAEEVLEDGKYGVLVPRASPEALADALVSAAAPGPQSEVAGAAIAARDHVVGKYSLKVMLDSYEDLYREVTRCAE